MIFIIDEMLIKLEEIADVDIKLRLNRIDSATSALWDVWR